MRASFSPSWNFHGMQLRLLLVLCLGLAACDELNVTFEDASTDALSDVTGDPAEDTQEEELPPPCDYPSGPYAFNAVGDTVARMVWPDAERGLDETTGADLEAFYCDPDVHSVFIQLVTIDCPLCPTRMRDIGALSGHWEDFGAKWIFVVADAPSAAAADTYTKDQYVTFGWSTNDEDNSEGSNTIVAAPIHGSTVAVPWTGVIRTSDMQIFDAASGSSLDIEAIARELASP